MNPQTSIEDLGLWPFAVLEGKLVVSCACSDVAFSTVPDAAAKGKAHPKTAPVYCEASIHGVRHECGKDATRSGVTCERLGETAADLPIWPFGIVLSAGGELVEVRHNALDSEEARGIKQNLVTDLAFAEPAPGEGAGARYTRVRKTGDATVTTTLRVRPYTQLAHRSNPPVDGLMVSKTRTSEVLPAKDGVFAHRRRSWVYMVVGGDGEYEQPTAVPTRVVSTDEAEVNPAVIPAALNTTGHLFVLSRLELDLRSTGTVQPDAVKCPFAAAAQAKKEADAAEAAVKDEEEADQAGGKKAAPPAPAKKAANATEQEDAKQFTKAMQNEPKAASPPPPVEDGSEPAPERATPTPAPASLLELAPEAPTARLTALEAFSAVSDSLPEVMSSVGSPSGVRPAADRFMAEQDDEFDQLADAEAVSFGLGSNVPGQTV